MYTDTPKPSLDDEEFQNHILKGVSRTFALTIPQLPPRLSRVVSNAYLLCRIADSIEDDKDMSLAHKREFSEFLIAIVAGDKAPARFSKDLIPLLSKSSPTNEIKLIKNLNAIIRITHSLNKNQHTSLTRCLRTMLHGMTKYQENNVHNGLKTQQEMDSYCYFVAGVVGEMLTELFCDYSYEINQHYDELMKLSISFGQGLQMTNILKDIWDDKERNMCWLPQDIFQRYGSDLFNLSSENITDGDRLAIGHLIEISRIHLESALEYSLIIPTHETGIRRFCLWALGMAILTLHNINQHRDFTSGQQVKITKINVKVVILLANLLTKHDGVLKWLFNFYARKLK